MNANGRISAATKEAKTRSQPSERAEADLFPLEVYPPWFRGQVESLSHRLQVSCDMPATFGLSVISAAVGSTLRVRAWRGFEVPAFVWTVTVAASGENKTACVNAMKEPIASYHQRRREAEAPDLKRATVRHELLTRQAEELALRATKGKGDMQEAEDAMVEARKAQPRPLFQLTFDGATTEALIKQLVDQSFLAHLEGEGDIFTDIAGRYDSNGLLKQYLDAFDGGAIDLHRIGRGHISAPRVGLVLGVMLQPDMLAGVMREGQFKGRGLLERCLYAMPRTLVGSRDTRALEGNEVAESRYLEQVLAICAQHHDANPDGSPLEPRILSLTSGAKGAFEAYRARLEPRLKTDLSAVVSWVNKVQGGLVLRLAGLLAVVWDVDACEVTTDVMERAALLMERFFIPQALRTFGDLRGDAGGHLLQQVLPWLRTQSGEFTARELQRARGDLFKTADETRDFLETLVEECVVVRVHRPRTSSSGPAPKAAYRHIRRPNPTQSSAQPSTNTVGFADSANSSDLSDLSGGQA